RSRRASLKIRHAFENRRFHVLGQAQFIEPRARRIRQRDRLLLIFRHMLGKRLRLLPRGGKQGDKENKEQQENQEHERHRTAARVALALEALENRIHRVGEQSRHREDRQRAAHQIQQKCRKPEEQRITEVAKKYRVERSVHVRK